MRRRAIVLAAAVVALGSVSAAPGFAVAPDAVPDGAATSDRIDGGAEFTGGTRYDTAAEMATRAFPDGSANALVATGLNFPDALAASYLAGNVSAPVLLTDRDTIPAATLKAFDELGTTTVTVLGLTDAVSAEVVAELRDRFGDDNVEVIGGTTRRETAAQIAIEGGEVGTAPDLSGGDTPLRTVIVARADAFPDALASGPLAFDGTHPILLTDQNVLPDATEAALLDDTLDVEQVILTGGPVAVSAEVEAEIAALDGIVNVARVAGETRTETAVELASVTRTARGWDTTDISLARGDFFPDALTLAPYAAKEDASLYLTQNPQTTGGYTFDGIQQVCNAVDRVFVAGGPDAISPDAEGEALLATLCADHVFPLSGDQEVPGPGDADATGTGWVYTSAEGVCYALDVDGVDGLTAGHIHEAVAGASGAPEVELPSLPDPAAFGFAADCIEESVQLAADIDAEPFAYYVNLHNAEFPDGAVRGQLDGNADMTVALRGTNEVEQDEEGNDLGFVDEPAAGEGTLELFLGDGELCWNITVSGLASPVDPAIAGGLHIHEAAVNANGPVVVALPQDAARTDYTNYDCVDVEQDLLDEIAATPSDYYANLHTVEGGDPDTPLNGTLRGQLGATSNFRIFGDAELEDGDPANPVYGQGLEGYAAEVSLFAVGADTICVQAPLPDPGEDLTGAHIHVGAVDQNGDVVLDFADLAGTRGGNACVTDAVNVPLVLADLQGHYFNIHSATFAAPLGVARGQLAGAIEVGLDGSQEVDTEGNLGAGDLTAFGTATLFQGSLDNPDLVCGAIHVEGADPLTATHIHEAAAGANGDVVVTLGDYGDPGLEAPGAAITDAFGCEDGLDETTVTDIFTEATTADYYVNVHSETFIAGAVRGQLA